MIYLPLLYGRPKVLQGVSSFQGRIQPVSLGGDISVIFGSQVLLRVHYCKTD